MLRRAPFFKPCMPSPSKTFLFLLLYDMAAQDKSPQNAGNNEKLINSNQPSKILTYLWSEDKHFFNVSSHILTILPLNHGPTLPVIRARKTRRTPTSNRVLFAMSPITSGDLFDWGTHSEPGWGAIFTLPGFQSRQISPALCVTLGNNNRIRGERVARVGRRVIRNLSRRDKNTSYTPSSQFLDGNCWPWL